MRPPLFAMAVLTLLIAATQAKAADDPARFPAAQCAALWYGQNDYAHASAFLPPDPHDVRLADAFRAVALRLTTGTPATIDAFIAKQRPLMAFMVEAYIYGGDKPSRDLYESLMQDCAAFAADQPETRSLR